jgi:phenylpropionate dioxygenase-like ring-hydroxylating dioxygenase large terminal subunit
MYIKNQWYLVCLIDELAQTNPLPKKIIGENVVVFKSQKGVINVVEDRCCHRNVKLSLGYVKDDCIKCAYHGWEFNGDGKCLSYANRDNFKIKEEGGKNMLTNEKDGKFTITELEVWSIKEVVINFMILIDIGRMKTLRETERKTQREKRE